MKGFKEYRKEYIQEVSFNIPDHFIIEIDNKKSNEYKIAYTIKSKESDKWEISAWSVLKFIRPNTHHTEYNNLLDFELADLSRDWIKIEDNEIQESLYLWDFAFEDITTNNEFNVTNKFKNDPRTSIGILAAIRKVSLMILDDANNKYKQSNNILTFSSYKSGDTKNESRDKLYLKFINSLSSNPNYETTSITYDDSTHYFIRKK